MGKVSASWKKINAQISLADGPKGLKVAFDEIEDEVSDRGVYVIRMLRPYQIAYPKRASPVLYIGEGNTRIRLTSHFKGWLTTFGNDFPSASVEVMYIEPRRRNNPKAHCDVEADLLCHFDQFYGTIPLFNSQMEYHNRDHSYPKDFFRVLGPGSGRGYKWAITPWASNDRYFREYGNY